MRIKFYVSEGRHIFSSHLICSDWTYIVPGRYQLLQAQQPTQVVYKYWWSVMFIIMNILVLRFGRLLGRAAKRPAHSRSCSRRVAEMGSWKMLAVRMRKTFPTSILSLSISLSETFLKADHSIFAAICSKCVTSYNSTCTDYPIPTKPVIASW